MEEFEQEVKQVIVDSLMLERTVEEIGSEETLFQEGLELDSIDVLELSLEFERRYGVVLRANHPQIREIYTNVGTLAAYLYEHKSDPSPS